MSELKFITPEQKERLLTKSDLTTVIRNFHPELKKSGSSFTGKCPSCNSDSFSFKPADGKMKCFRCGTGAGDAIGYLHKFQGKAFLDAVSWLAEFFNYDIIAEQETDKKMLPAYQPHQPHNASFRDRQLASSGITEAAQQFTLAGLDTTLDRYTAGSLDGSGTPMPGGDMLLHYVGLDDKLISYKRKTGAKETPYIRIRYAMPSLHLDEDGKEVRYRSPAGGGNHLWIPERIRQAFKSKEQIRTLVFVEGEKKSDALCLAGIPAVGISGIHNFSTTNEMPAEIERLIRSCSVQKVVFWFDSDIMDLGSDLTERADFRPYIFSLAAIKFRTYFSVYQQHGIDIRIYICHGLNTELKGADDLLISFVKNSNVPELDSNHPVALDFNNTITSHNLTGDHIKLFDVTSVSDSQIKEIWKIHSNKAFMQAHKEQLKSVGEFKIYKSKYRYNAATDDFEIAEHLASDEQFWAFEPGRFGVQIKFKYLNATNFLTRRGFYRQRVNSSKTRFIHSIDNIVREIDAEYVQQYVYDFTRSIDELNVLEMLMCGGTQYLGPDKLKNLPYVELDLVKSSPDSQILVLKDKFWLITAEKITEHKHAELPGMVWSTNVLPHSPELRHNFLTITQLEPGVPNVECLQNDCDIWRYIRCTSDVAWRSGSLPGGAWPKAGEFTEADVHRLKLLHQHAADKILAAGYVLRNHREKSLSRAIIAMDFVENAAGLSEGGTGKSVFGGMFEHIIKQFYIDGKSAKLTEDPFLFDGVDDKTGYIIVDDCRRTLDFEFFLSKITKGITANWKGMQKFVAGLIPFIFTTNHSIRGIDRSFLRRQYIIAFSDYFNQERDLRQVLGHEMFDDWHGPLEIQWDYFLNFMAHAIQLNMRYRLKTWAPDEEIQRRRLRDMIGEAWLDWFESTYYIDSPMFNIRRELDGAIDNFLKANSSQRPFTNRAEFKKRAKLWCKYAGYEFNKPAGKDGRIRNGDGNIEFYVISNELFDINLYQSEIKMPSPKTNEIPF